MTKLLDAGANPNILSNKGITPLSCVCVRAPFHERRRMVRILLKYGATIDKLAPQDVAFVEEVKSQPGMLQHSPPRQGFKMN